MYISQHVYLNVYCFIEIPPAVQIQAIEEDYDSSGGRSTSGAAGGK